MERSTPDHTQSSDPLTEEDLILEPGDPGYKTPDLKVVNCEGSVKRSPSQIKFVNI